MIFNETDYMKGTSSLLKEAFKLKKYKAMPSALAVLTAIFMSPWILGTFFLAVANYVLGFFFKTMTAPIDYLHSLANKEGKEVKHATQFIIYCISWPLIFFLYASVAATVFLLTITYALLSCFCYIASLGGFRFHLFLSDVEVFGSELRLNGKYKTWKPLWFVLLSITILGLLPLGETLWYYLVEISETQREYFFELDFADIWESMTLTFKYYHLDRINLFVWFSALYSLIVMSRSPKAIEEEV